MPRKKDKVPEIILRHEIFRDTRREEYVTKDPEKVLFLKIQQRTDIATMVDAMETDKAIHFAVNEYHIHLGNKASFYRRTGRSGFSFIKDTRELHVWFNMPILKIFNSAFELDKDFEKFMKMEWLSQIKNWPAYLTKGMLKEIFMGRISNPEKFYKYFLRRIVKINVPVAKFVRYMHEVHFMRNETTPKSKCFILQYAKNAESAIDHFIKEGSTMLPQSYHDLFNQAVQLDERIRFNWGACRMEKEHRKFTDRILKVMLKYSPTAEIYNYRYLHELLLPSGYELITTERDLLIEGTRQHNCVYTNYRGEVKKRRTYIFKADVQGKHLTIQVSVYSREINPEYQYEADNAYKICAELNKEYVAHVGQIASSYNRNAPNEAVIVMKGIVKQQGDLFLKETIDYEIEQTQLIGQGSEKKEDVEIFW